MKISFHRLFFLFLIFFAGPLQAWNEDFAKSSFPAEKKVCLFRGEGNEKGNTLRLHSVDEEEGCAAEEETYLFVKGVSPEGSLAFVPISDYKNKDQDEQENETPFKRFPSLQKFTCMGKMSFEILGAKAGRYVPRGEIFSSSDKQVCSNAYENAVKACKEQLGGVEVLEKCY